MSVENPNLLLRLATNLIALNHKYFSTIHYLKYRRNTYIAKKLKIFYKIGHERLFYKYHCKKEISTKQFSILITNCMKGLECLWNLPAIY